MDLRSELETLLERYSLESSSTTPEYILAGYMLSCLNAFDVAVAARDQWYKSSGTPLPSAPKLDPVIEEFKIPPMGRVPLESEPPKRSFMWWVKRLLWNQ